MMTGASREMRRGLPMRYSSVMTSPTTTIVRSVKDSGRPAAQLPSSAPPVDRPLHGVEQVAGDVIGRCDERVAPVFPLSQTVAGQHEDAASPDRRRDGLIRGLVTHDGRGTQLDAELGRRLEEQPRPGLAAVTLGAPRRLAFAGVVSAHVDAVEMSTGLLELIREPGGDGMENLFREVPASHACLVGHDDGGNAALV